MLEAVAYSCSLIAQWLDLLNDDAFTDASTFTTVEELRLAVDFSRPSPFTRISYNEIITRHTHVARAAQFIAELTS